MCIAIPKKVLGKKENNFLIFDGKKESIASSLINVKKGDYVISIDGIIIEKIERKDVESFYKILKKC